MQRATHDRVECARDSLVGADAQPGAEHHSSVGPFEPSVAAHSRCVGTNAIGIGADDWRVGLHRLPVGTHARPVGANEPLVGPNGTSVGTRERPGNTKQTTV